MPAAYEHAVVRVVPRVEREEFVNVGVLVFCEAHDAVTMGLALDETRLLALAPDLDLDLVRANLAAMDRVARGGDEAGPIGALPARERWRWLVAPRSTILQTSPAHGGVLGEVELGALVDRLLDRYVRLQRSFATNATKPSR